MANQEKDMEEREKLYILVPLIVFYPCFLEKGPHIFIFLLDPANYIAGSVCCLWLISCPPPPPRYSCPIFARSLSEIQASSLQWNQKKSRRVGDSKLFFYGLCLYWESKSLFRKVWAPWILKVAKIMEQ